MKYLQNSISVHIRSCNKHLMQIDPTCTTFHMCVFDVAMDHSNHLFTLWTVVFMVTMFTMRYGWCLAMPDLLDAPLKNNLTST